jgi:TIR domain-containing protein
MRLEAPLIFISYSHRDRFWLDALKEHLEPLEGRGLIGCWADTDIKPAENWREAIRAALHSAAAVVLLASPAFFGSKFIREEELPFILDELRKRPKPLEVFA